MLNEKQLKELRNRHKGYSNKEFREKLNLTAEQKKLIAEQFMAIKWHFCVGRYKNQDERLIILDEMKCEFGVSELMRD